MTRVCTVGLRYVGLVQSACLAELGHSVTGLDINAERVARLTKGELPLFEVGLADLVRANLVRGLLRFSTSYADALPGSAIIFIAVHTPPGPTGAADLTAVRESARMIALHVHGDAVVVTKSTVPIGTGEVVSSIMQRNLRKGETVTVAANPEFLREGSADHVFFHPDRIVIGCPDRAGMDALRRRARPRSPRWPRRARPIPRRGRVGHGLFRNVDAVRVF